MSTLQDEERPLDEEIVRSVMVAVPESWVSATLTVTCSEAEGVVRYAHSLLAVTRDGRTVPVMPEDELFDATFRLRNLFEKHGRGWIQATYRVDRTPDGGAGYAVDFAY